MAYARYFCDRTGLSGKRCCRQCVEAFGPDLFPVKDCCSSTMVARTVLDPCATATPPRPPFACSTSPTAAVHRPKSGAGAGHGTVYPFLDADDTFELAAFEDCYGICGKRPGQTAPAVPQRDA